MSITRPSFRNRSRGETLMPRLLRTGHGSRWEGLEPAGVLVVYPGESLLLFTTVGGVLLIIIGVVTLIGGILSG